MQDEYVSFGAAWFTLSLINAGLAQGKRRSGFAWWLLSLFLGPIATFLIVVFPHGGEEPQSRPDALTGTQVAVLGAVVLAVVLAIGAFIRFAN